MYHSNKEKSTYDANIIGIIAMILTIACSDTNIHNIQ